MYTVNDTLSDLSLAVWNLVIWIDLMLCFSQFKVLQSPPPPPPATLGEIFIFQSLSNPGQPGESYSQIPVVDRYVHFRGPIFAHGIHLK